jgi:hypothetical protein
LILNFSRQLALNHIAPKKNREIFGVLMSHNMLEARYLQNTIFSIVATNWRPIVYESWPEIVEEMLNAEVGLPRRGTGHARLICRSGKSATRNKR